MQASKSLYWVPSLCLKAYPSICSTFIPSRGSQSSSIRCLITRMHRCFSPSRYALIRRAATSNRSSHTCCSIGYRSYPAGNYHCEHNSQLLLLLVCSGFKSPKVVVMSIASHRSCHMSCCYCCDSQRMWECFYLHWWCSIPANVAAATAMRGSLTSSFLGRLTQCCFDSHLIP